MYVDETAGLQDDCPVARSMLRAQWSHPSDHGLDVVFTPAKRATAWQEKGLERILADVQERQWTRQERLNL